MKVEERFWSKVNKGPGCWEWQAATDQDGYGRLTVQRINLRVHTLSYIMKYGPIEKEICVLHHCDNPPCVNPEHLFLGTKKDNKHDSMKKGRNFIPIGENHGRSKLTEAQVRAILKDTRFNKEIAKDYGVVQSTISAIKRKQLWTYIDA